MNLSQKTALGIDKIFVYALAVIGIFGICIAFIKFGIVGAGVIAIIPFALCCVYASFKNPALSMIALFVVNYFVSAVGRQFYDAPVGLIIDVGVWYNISILMLRAIFFKTDWSRAATSLTLVAALWMVYVAWQFVNPQVVSLLGWFTSARSVAVNFLLIIIIGQIVFTNYKYLKYLLYVWSILTLIAIAKCLIQKFIGFSDNENYWLWVLDGHTTHIIGSGVRYFSFFNEAANFGANMGLAMVVLSISALYFKNIFTKIYMLAVAGLALYCMLLSGTRSAIVIPFVGYGMYVLMSKNVKVSIIGGVAVLGTFAFLNFTTIGEGNALIRRSRSTFNTQDASFQARLDNQAKLRELLKDKPFGAGLGHGGNNAVRFAPNAKLSYIPPDSWFVLIWIEMGIVGLILHILALLYVARKVA